MSTIERVPSYFGILVALAIGGAACKKDKVEEPLPAAPASAAAAASTAESATAAPVGSASSGAADTSDDDVPLPEDFAEQAAREITESNLEAELSKLEKEVAATEE